MSKPICADCGTVMLECFTKRGLRLYVCLHKSANAVDNRVGKPKHVLIYCGNEIFGLRKAFNNMTHGTDLTLKKLQTATENKIDAADLYKSANLALELKFEANILPKLFAAAMTLGYSLGLNATKSIESLVVGIARKSRLVLDNIGVIFLAEQAYRWYRTKHKIETATLTESERHEAWQGYAIKSVIETAARLKTPLTVTPK